MLRRAEAANATTPQFAVLYPCSSRPFERRWYSDTIFAGHEIVCFSKATIEDVRRAAVLVDSFVNHRNRPEGLSVKSLLLKRLGLPYDVMRGKVLVHINDEYGGRPLNLSFVKYLNQGGAESMDTDPHGGLTQDQIM